MSDLLRNWNFARVLRLMFAGVFLAAGISGGEVLAYIAAAVFGLQAIFNVGCCGSACAPAGMNRKAVANVQEVDYEEVKGNG